MKIQLVRFFVQGRVLMKLLGFMSNALTERDVSAGIYCPRSFRIDRPKEDDCRKG